MNTLTQETATTRIDLGVLSGQPTRALLRLMAQVAAILCVRCAIKARLAWQRHATRDELRLLNAEALRDIGVTRDEVRRECAKWFWQE